MPTVTRTPKSHLRPSNAAGSLAHAVSIGLAGALMALASKPTLSETAWSLDAGAGHTDNATLVETNPVSDTLSSIGGSIAYSIDSRRIQAYLNGRGNFVHYADKTYDDDFQGLADGSFQFGIVPDTLHWSFNDTYGQIAIRQFEPVTPDNRQNVNNFSTGPDLILPMGSQTDLKLSARYGDVRYEDSDLIDSSNLNASLTLRRNISEDTYLGLVASDTRVEYDVQGIEPYDRPALYGSLQSTGARQSLSVDIGVNRVDLDDETFTKPLVRIDWNRRVTPSWSLNVDLSSEYRNTSEQFANQAMQLGASTSNVGVSAIPAATYQGAVNLEFKRPRVQFRLGGGYLQSDYVTDNGLNEETRFGNAELSRRLTPRLQGFIDYRVEDRTYESNPVQDSERQIAGARLELQAGKAGYLALGYRRTESTSESSRNTYTEAIYFLSLSYRQGSAATQSAFAR